MLKHFLVLGALVLSSSSAFAQCRNVSPAQYGLQSYGAQSYGVQSGAYYDARTGGRYVNPNAGYYGNQVPNNVRVYQDQLNQSMQVGAYNAYNNASGYNYGYNNNVYNNGYTNQMGQVTITPQYTSNQPGYVGVNPWNGYAGQSYNGYNYGQVANQYRGRNCRPQHQAFNQRFWVNR